MLAVAAGWRTREPLAGIGCGLTRGTLSRDFKGIANVGVIFWIT